MTSLVHIPRPRKASGQKSRQVRPSPPPGLSPSPTTIPEAEAASLERLRRAAILGHSIHRLSIPDSPTIHRMLQASEERDQYLQAIADKFTKSNYLKKNEKDLTAMELGPASDILSSLHPYLDTEKNVNAVIRILTRENIEILLNSVTQSGSDFKVLSDALSKIGNDQDVKSKENPFVNEAVLEKLPTETKSRIGIEIEPAVKMEKGQTPAKKSDLQWIEDHWHESITIAYLTKEGQPEEEALNLTFDGTPSAPAIEIRTEPKPPDKLLTKAVIEKVVGTLRRDKLGEKETGSFKLEGSKYFVRWEPQGDWPNHITHLGGGNIKIEPQFWNNIHVSHTIPIRNFLRLCEGDQNMIFPKLNYRLKDLKEFFGYFASKALEPVSTTSRDNLISNIKTPLDTLHQVLGEIQSDERAQIVKQYSNSTGLPNMNVDRPKSAQEFRPPTRQTKEDKHHLSVEEKPKLPFFDPRLRDIRVLIEHRNKKPSTLRNLVFDYVVKNGPPPKRLIELFKEMDTPGLE